MFEITLHFSSFCKSFSITLKIRISIILYWDHNRNFEEKRIFDDYVRFSNIKNMGEREDLVDKKWLERTKLLIINLNLL